MTPFATWILIPPQLRAHPNTTAKPIISVRLVARNRSTKTLRNISITINIHITTLHQWTKYELLETSFDKSQQPIAKTVCGGKIKDTTSFPSAIYEGEQVYFCTRACLRVFEENPDAFVAGEIDHPLGDD
jgi:YHS domain-containing protein